MHKMIMTDRKPGVNPFSCTEEILDQLELSLSLERWATWPRVGGPGRTP